MPLKRFIQTPPQAPTRNYDVANKKYVDEHVPYVSGGGSGTTGQMVKWTGSATMGDATNTDAEVASAVTLKHTQNTDSGTSSTSFFFGSESVDGSWRLVISGDTLSVQKRESGNWVEKGSFT